MVRTAGKKTHHGYLVKIKRRKNVEKTKIKAVYPQDSVPVPISKQNLTMPINEPQTAPAKKRKIVKKTVIEAVSVQDKGIVIQGKT